MSETKKQVNRLLLDDPIGKISPKNARYGTDEAGRVYVYESIESVERKKEHARRSRDKRHFTFSHMRHIREITDNMSNKHCGYVLMLQPYIEYKTNLIVKQGRTPEPMTEKEIAEAWGVTKRTCKTVLAELEVADIIEKVNDHYRINERYHFRNKVEVDVDMLVKTFQTAVKSLDLKPAELGVVYKLLPYVHYESNLVCENPFETDSKKVIFLNKTQIAKNVGIPRQKFDEVLKKLTIAQVLATIQRKSWLSPEEVRGGDGRETVVLINPNIITRIKGEPNATIKQIFN